DQFVGRAGARRQFIAAGQAGALAQGGRIPVSDLFQQGPFVDRHSSILGETGCGRWLIRRSRA
ncbi:MAG: hypothetical protein M1541_17630, partial [Acidobacteria bacterium]|nr:hypothetical protein [Acidobacteriota bacterium]